VDQAIASMAGASMPPLLAAVLLFWYAVVITQINDQSTQIIYHDPDVLRRECIQELQRGYGPAWQLPSTFDQKTSMAGNSFVRSISFCLSFGTL
jgi:hypothetical protein